MERVVILLSAFNGEKYIGEQLQSILDQTGVFPIVVVRDDGSCDATGNIIKGFKQKYPDNFIILEGNNVGWKKSFFTLIKFAYSNFTDYKYFAFCDQDDVWQPEKLETAITTLRNYSDIPALYFSNLYFYKDGVNRGLINKATVLPTFKNCLARNYATGCSIVFNSKLLDCLSMGEPNVDIPHDHWAYMVAVLCGKAVYDSNSYILYRQHDTNQIGSKHGLIDVWKARFRRFAQPELENIREKTAKDLLRLYASEMYPEARVAVEKIARYKQSVFKRISLLFDSGYTLGNLGNDFFFKLRIIFGKL